MKPYVLMLALLAACSSAPPPPAWQLDARDGIDAFTADYLAGHTAASEAEFRRARSAATATGRFDAVIQLELVRCAAQAASLDINDCPGYGALAQEATREQRAYADYLAGRWQQLERTALPAQHQALLAGGKLEAMADPLARLVAAGALLRSGNITPQQIEVALATSSEQGWRRPLLAWLGVQLQRAQAAGDAQAAAQLKRRIALASETRE